MVRISVVMPVYNNEKYFPKAVESVVNQNYDNYELIIVDDGSTDRTSEIADTLQKSNPHIRVIHQENQWIYNSFNNGIAEAKGEYIYILNSDDKLMLGALELFDRKIDEYHPDIIWTKVLMHKCDEEQNIVSYDYKHLNDRVQEEVFYANKKEVENAWPFFLSSVLAQNQANLYRCEIMKKYKFRNDVYGADTLYNISIADDIDTALILKEPIYNYFLYEKKSMNASIGKYYGYEHEMFNEIYLNYYSLFQNWNLEKNLYEKVLCNKRMIYLTAELRNLQAANCPLSLDEKLCFAFYGCIDEVIRECVVANNCQEELESRILSAVRELLVKEQLSSDSRMYFVYELLDSLLRYEKDEEDFQKIRAAINHPLNPAHIGKTFYDKLMK